MGVQGRSAWMEEGEEETWREADECLSEEIVRWDRWVEGREEGYLNKKKKKNGEAVLDGDTWRTEGAPGG